MWIVCGRGASAPAPVRNGASERDVVFGHVGGLAHRARLAAAVLAIGSAGPSTAATRAAASEQGHTIRLDLGRVALVTVLIVPLPRLDPPFDGDLFALGQILAERLRGLAPD